MATNVSSVTKHFPSAQNGFTTTLGSTISSGAATVPLNSVAGYNNGEVAVFIVDPSDVTKKQTFTGTIDTSGVQVTGVVWTAGTNQSHSGGATVVDYASATHISMISKGLKVEHNENGTHGDVTTDSINNAGVLTQTGATTITGALTLKSYDGWITEARTWTYASGATTNVGTFTIAGEDVTTVYNVGDRVKFTQTTVKYGIITKVAFSTNTTVTIYMGTDYTIANAAITAPALSHDRSPAGFPMDPAKWTITTTDSGDRATSASGSWANLTTTIVAPIGAWRFTSKLPGQLNLTAASLSEGRATWSSNATNETNPNITAYWVHKDASAAADSRGGVTAFTEDYINVSSSTTFTLMGITGGAGTLTIRGNLSGVPILAKLICAYL